jgi:DnaJ-class molecular chaperone
MAPERPPNKPKKSIEEMERKCDNCDGTGKVTYPNAKRAVDCPKCKGKGWTFK